MIETNSLIKASAGTGKTYALATRVIRQMLIDRIDPKTIVALTFSRAAAQEIYTKILMRLCAAATDAAGAAREWETLLADFRGGCVPDAAAKLAWIEAQGISHGAADFRRLLRTLVETQHLGSIATLDSFILRIVRNFPMEMGFQNAVEVLDEMDESEAVEEAVRALLAKPDGAGEAIAQAFWRAKDGAFSRTCLSAIGMILNKAGWRNFVVAHPACRKWTVESMCAALDVPMESVCPDLSGLPLNEIRRKNAISYEEKFVQFVQSYDGSTSPLDVSDGVKNLMLHFWTNPAATSYDYAYYNVPYTFACGADGAATVRAAIRHVMNLYLKRRLEVVQAKIALVTAVEETYERLTRRMGKLTFGDFTAFSSERGQRGIDIQNVQFRFDARFDHWALDEFQDTSDLQWKCLRDLVEEVANAGRAGEARSAMAVGDLKQSIYTWRGASARPFEQLSGWEAFAGCARDFKESHRYGPNIAAFVNLVFGRGSISRGGIIPCACCGAVDAWAEGWVDHVSHEASDFVKVIGAKVIPGSEEDPVLSALHEEVQALWARHEAAHSAETVGILVRNNDRGLEVAEYLRAKGLPVVWEGKSPVHDLPVVEAVLALLTLGDHPADGYAWRTANDLFPVRQLLLPACPTAAAVSAAVSRLLTRQGLARTLKDFCGVLREKGGLLPGGLSCERLKQLVEKGVIYEARGSFGGVDGFVRFLADAQRREIAVSADVIRILTIHRSKGLGIDHVFVPLFEGQRGTAAIDAPTVSTPLYDGGDWVLPHLKKGCEALNAKTRAAYANLRSARLMESLRTYYVALTRSKKSLFVIFPNDSKPEDYAQGLLMRDLIVSAVNRKLPYVAGEPPAFPIVEAAASQAEKPRVSWAATARRREDLVRATPSSAVSTSGAMGLRAAALFDGDFGAAAQRGLEVHAAYQKIEWADAETAATLPPDFRVAFVKPSEEATVWRERGYELFDGAQWASGRFDRVVFTGVGASRQATIYDFKTNAKAAGESDAAFAHRLRAQYAPQMEAYCRALARLTGLPDAHIAAALLVTATGQCVTVRRCPNP